MYQQINPLPLVLTLFTILKFYISKIVCYTPEHKKLLLLLD